jgi:hypothetical protein
MTTKYRRKRTNDKRTSDQYLDDDILKDGEFLRVPMTLADSALRDTVRATHPPQMHYGRGYVRDTGSHRIVDARQTISDPVEEGGAGWPSANVELYPYWQHSVGGPCQCPYGSAGRLTPHPNESSLYCKPISEDAATVMDATQVWYAERARLSDEWKRYGPRRDSCCDGCADQNIADPSPPRSKPWPRPSFGSDPLQHWPDPATLKPSPVEGSDCMKNDKRPGRIRGGKCVADRRDAAPTNIGPPTARAGFEWAEGGECSLGNGELGRYVREGDRLTCKPRSEFDARTVDAQSIRDRAYYESVREAENAWRQKW